MTPARILTDEEVVQHFGDPANYIRDDGSVDPHWELLILRSFPMPQPLPLSGYPKQLVRRVRCHQKIAPFLSDALLEINARPWLWGTLHDWGGCYAWRLQRKAKEPSRHSWGIAVDVDVADNAQGDITPGMHPLVVSIMEEHGFYWGGRFHGDRIDGQHFEFADLTRIS